VSSKLLRECAKKFIDAVAKYFGSVDSVRFFRPVIDGDVGMVSLSEL